MAKIRLAITGGSGFIGRQFIQRFHDKYDIVVLSRKQLSFSHCEVRQCNYTAHGLKEVLSDCSAVLHLAAKRLHSSSKNDFQDNLFFDMNLFSTLSNLGIKNIVYTSTRGVYGHLPSPWHEKLTPQPDNLYALSKYQSEIAAEFFNRQHGLKIKTLRIAQVFGLGEYKSSAISTFIRKSQNNMPIEITVTGIEREYIYVKDLADAFDKALNNPDEKGVFNVGSEEVLSLEEIAKKIAKAFGREYLVRKSTTMKQIYEKSLMNSSLFRKTFDWKPGFSFKEACLDLAKMATSSTKVHHAT